MKKYIAFWLCLIMILSLFSCELNESQNGMSSNKNRGSSDINDNSTNDSSTVPDTSADSITNTANEKYDSVLEVYRRIIKSYPIVNQNPRAVAAELGIQGEEDTQTFIELYSSVMVFYPRRGKADGESPHYKLGCGYAIKDLNSDGVDELVLMNKDYYIMAIFSCSDGKPVLLGNYRERNSCWIDGEGLLHNNGSSGADYSTNAVFRIADGGESLELVAEFGTNGHEWIDDVAYTKYYKVVGGEKVSITESECTALAEQYGKYLGVAGADATKEYSGLTFTSLYTESEIAMEMYEAAINGEICVFDEQLDEIKLNACRFANDLRLDESIIDGKAVLDMDGDKICEYIIRSASMDCVILRYYDGKVYSYSFYFRDLFNVNADGSFFWNDSPAIYGSGKLTFDGELLIIKEIYKIVNDGEANAEYYIDGKQVAHEELLKYIAEHPNTPIDFTTFKAPWQKTISLEQAIKIASEHWNVQSGDVDKETGYRFAILPKTSSNENYRIALSLFVEETHYSTIEIIEIDAFTGNIIEPPLEPEG